METILATLEVVPEPFKSMASTLVDICAYAGTGNVLKVQHLLHICSEHYDTKDQVKAYVTCQFTPIGLSFGSFFMELQCLCDQGPCANVLFLY